MTINKPVTALLKHVTITLFITIIGLLIGNALPYSMLIFIDKIFMLLILISFIVAIASSTHSKEDRLGFPMAIAYGYSLLLGITSVPFINFHIKTVGIDTVLFVFIGTLGIVGLLALFSYFTDSDYILTLGSILFVGTIVLLILTIFMMVFSSFRIMDLGVTIFSIIIFSGWVIYDVYKFKINASYITSTRELAPYVLDIYLDIINLFIDILKLVRRFKK